MPVLDRIHTCFRCPDHALCTMRVRSYFSAQAMSIGHNRLHLFQCVLRSVGIIALGEHASGGADFDEISAVLDDLARLVLNVLYTVRHPIAGGVILVRQLVVVAVSTRNAERRTAD